MPETVSLPYGRKSLDIDLSDFRVKFSIFRPNDVSAREINIDDLHKSFENPIASAPLRELIAPEDSLCIVTGDNTRPYIPMRFMLHAIFDHLGFIPEKTTVIAGSGSHRPQSDIELQDIFCKKLYSSMKIIAHDSRGDENSEIGTLADGTKVTMNRRYIEADRKIVLGHIEPHFFAGFTGGPKGIAPAICGIETIHRLHSYDLIADSASAFGNIEDNPVAVLIRDTVALAPPDFLVNLVLNCEQKPVAAFSGHYLKAHQAGVRVSRELSQIETDRRFPIVISSNSGHPLDQNLYQTVKGIAAAYQLVEPGGTIIIVSECAKGIPSGSDFENLMSSGDSVETILRKLSNDKNYSDDRWQAQILCNILLGCNVILVSSLEETTVKKNKLAYAATVEHALENAVQRCNSKPEAAVLPYGPRTIIRIVE